jgi:tRNA-2-methylthio-N6-dimethylallyladenosine synthase
MTFLIHTYGCQMNVRDSEAAAALLEAAGHRQVRREAEAQLVLVNSCSVRAKAEDKAIGRLCRLAAAKRRQPERIVGVMGCMAQRLGEDLFRRVRGLDFVAGSRAIRHLPRLVAGAAGGAGRQTAPGRLDDPDVPRAHLPGRLSAFVTVLPGCDRRCAYCIVPDVRGPAHSRPAAETLAEVRALAAGGTREVTLLGQSVLDYGRHGGADPWAGAPPSPGGFREPFPRLLEALSALPGIARLRFTSAHPSGCTAELARAMRELPAVCPHIHLPLQSGADRVLARMRRGYTAAGYAAAVERLRAAVPDCAVTTDVIVGFPGETAADFEATRALMASLGFDNAFIFKYSPRPGTPAAAMADDVPAAEKERRNQVLLADQDRLGLARNTAWIGRQAEVLAEGPSPRNAARWTGRSRQNMIVIFPPCRKVGAGDLVRVRIESARPQTLHGRVATDEEES